MATSPAPNVVADRYLASPAGLRARPCGPVDALDTHAGRASQVRLVFLSGAWEEADLADAVARWCAIGCGEICGILDVGRHGDGWFLALPPTLGVPLDRWRTMRRPGPDDAARLTLAFGRLLDVVDGTGFPSGLAGVADLAVGPGPTAFLDRPLLPYPGAAPAASPEGGQRVLAGVLATLLGETRMPLALEDWHATAADRAFPGLAACLDALEQAAVAAAPPSDAEPPGVAGLFADPAADLIEEQARRDPGRARRIAGWVGAAAAALACAVVLLGAWSGADRTAQAAAPPPPASAPPAPATPPAAARSAVGYRQAAHRRRRHRPAHRSRHVAHRRTTPTPVPPAKATRPQAPTAAPTPPPAPPAPSGTVLPAPGGTVLPGP